MTDHLQIFKRPPLRNFSTDLDETGIKIHGLLRSFIQNIVIIRVAVPFKVVCSYVWSGNATIAHHGLDFLWCQVKIQRAIHIKISGYDS